MRKAGEGGEPALNRKAVDLAGYAACICQRAVARTVTYRRDSLDAKPLTQRKGYSNPVQWVGQIE